MNANSATLRPLALALLIFGLLIPAISADESEQKSFGFPPRQQVIGFLTQSIDWYRGASVQPPIIQPADVPFRENAEGLRIQSLQLSFDYAKAIAAAETGTSTSPEQQSAGSAREPSRSAPQRWMKIRALCETDLQNVRNDVMSVRHQADREHGKDRTRLDAALAESESRLNLLQEKCQTYATLLDFVRTMHASEPQNESLDAVIDDLSRTVPELAKAGGAPSPSQSAVDTAVPRETGSSIPDLISDVLLYRRKLRTLEQAGRATDALAQASNSLRIPLTQYLNFALQSANLSGTDPQQSDLESLRRQQARLDNLSTQITSLSPATVALDKQQILFGSYKSDLASWRPLVMSQYRSAWKRLMIHLFAFGFVVALLVAVIAALRRMTYRYVHDASHRRTALIAEWALLWLGIFLVVAFTFASNLGSLATFLGLVTAGLAVALQNVILAVLGYTVLVGKLGLRLGDQVQVSGVTGEVLEFGLLQFQVREIDTQGLPTGRIGSFSNSFIFVSPAIGIFKVGVAEKKTTSAHETLVVGPHGISIDPKTSNA